MDKLLCSLLLLRIFSLQFQVGYGYRFICKKKVERIINVFTFIVGDDPTYLRIS